MHAIWPTHLLLYRSAAAMQKAAACMLLPSLHRARSSRWNVSISKLTCSAHNTHQTAHSSMPRAHEVEHGREQRNDARKAILCYTSQLGCEAPCHFFPINITDAVRKEPLTYASSQHAGSTKSSRSSRAPPPHHQNRSPDLGSVPADLRSGPG